MTTYRRKQDAQQRSVVGVGYSDGAASPVRFIERSGLLHEQHCMPVCGSQVVELAASAIPDDLIPECEMKEEASHLVIFA